MEMILYYGVYLGTLVFTYYLDTTALERATHTIRHKQKRKPHFQRKLTKLIGTHIKRAVLCTIELSAHGDGWPSPLARRFPFGERLGSRSSPQDPDHGTVPGTAPGTVPGTRSWYLSDRRAPLAFLDDEPAAPLLDFVAGLSPRGALAAPPPLRSDSDALKRAPGREPESARASAVGVHLLPNRAANGDLPRSFLRTALALDGPRCGALGFGGGLGLGWIPIAISSRRSYHRHAE